MTDEWISRLEVESRALKQGFERAAMTMPLSTESATFQTTANTITMVNDGTPSSFNDPERVVVTFNTATGANTNAKLEMTSDNPSTATVRRVPYVGGARWHVTAYPRYESGWVSTRYVFSVQSFLRGTLSVSEMTS